MSLHNISSCSSNYAELNSAAKYVKGHTTENDEICLYGVDPMLYYLSDRLPCTKYIYQWVVFEVLSDAREKYFDDIRQKRPKLIAVSEGNLLSIPQDILANYNLEEIPDCPYIFLNRDISK